MTRRTAMAGMAGAAALLGARGASGGARAALPPEWGPHAGCVMAWTASWEVYSEREIAAIRRDQAKVAKAIASFEPVTLLANPEDAAEARRMTGPGVDVVPMALADMWTRDTLPTFARDAGGGLEATGWNFNVWGGKYPGYENDLDLAERSARFLGADFLAAGIVAEGGAFEVDGAGTLLTTETCLLNPNRNPGLGRGEIEAALMAGTGARHVIWLHGSDADEVTDGHIDGLARIIAPGLAVVEISDDPEDPEYRDLRENARMLEAARDARGERLEVIRLLRPRWDEMPERGDDFAASYVNAYFPNGGLVMSRFGDGKRDRAARDLFAALEPDRRIVQLDVPAICEAGGGVHCNTMQIPA